MSDFQAIWAIAGGWAIDSFLGKCTRTHEDIEISILRKDQLILQNYMKEWEWRKVINGVIEPWLLGEWLELPLHETHCEKGNSRIEFLLNESTEQDWVFRRDFRISRPIKRAFLISQHGIPFLCPEIVLLYKSKNTRDKDDLDFKNTINSLDSEQKIWLKKSLITVYQEHPWIKHL